MEAGTPECLPEEGADPLAADGDEVVRNLSLPRKRIDPHYIYDEQGTALFEKQCGTEDYYLRRAETGLLLRHADDIAARRAPASLVELGAGTCEKTEILLSAYERRGLSPVFHPIDVDGATLRVSVGRLRARFPTLVIQALATTYDNGLRRLIPLGSRLTLFLGSSLGNLALEDMTGLLSMIHARSGPGDGLLVGVDLHKATDVIHRAYNDAEGYGPRSTLNVLDHLNRRYQGDFVVDQFDYRSRYDPLLRRNDVVLVSRQAQVVTLRRLNFTVRFAAGEIIEVEMMWKFDLAQWRGLLGSEGFVTDHEWIDRHHHYALLLMRRD